MAGSKFRRGSTRPGSEVRTGWTQKQQLCVCIAQMSCSRRRYCPPHRRQRSGGAQSLGACWPLPPAGRTSAEPPSCVSVSSRCSNSVFVPQLHKESSQFLKRREKSLKLRRRINPANLVRSRCSSDPIKSNQTRLWGGGLTPQRTKPPKQLSYFRRHLAAKAGTESRIRKQRLRPHQVM